MYSPNNFQLYQLLTVMNYVVLQEYENLKIDDIELDNIDIDIDIEELEKELAEIDASEEEKSSGSPNISFYI
jgi:hypothetical protein